MRFALCGVLTANARGKIAGELEFAELAANALAISAGDDAEIEFPGEEADDPACASKQRRVFEFVGASPEAVRFDPFGAGELGSTVNAQPIGGIVLREFVLGPVDPQSV